MKLSFANQSHIYAVCNVPGEKDLFAVHMDKLAGGDYKPTGTYYLTMPLTEKESDMWLYDFTYNGRTPDCININYCKAHSVEDWWIATEKLDFAKAIQEVLNKSDFLSYDVENANECYTSLCFELGKLIDPVQMFTDNCIGVTPSADNPDEWLDFFEKNFIDFMEMSAETYEKLKYHVDWEGVCRDFLADLHGFEYRFGDDPSREVVCYYTPDGIGESK